MWSRSIAAASLLLASAAADWGGYPASPPDGDEPSEQPLCDKYTIALFQDNTAENQQTLLTVLVNTVVIGSYSNTPDKPVPGILAVPEEGPWKDVNLLQYFDGSLYSTNFGYGYPIATNFLDSGGAEPLKKNMPAWDNNSLQYILLTHLYKYFAGLLGCTLYGNTVSPYDGRTSMYEVHKYMSLNELEVGYFINQTGEAALSLGVSQDDVGAVAKALQDAFLFKCSLPKPIPATATPALQAICIEPSCPPAMNEDCSLYEPVYEPYPVS